MTCAHFLSLNPPTSARSRQFSVGVGAGTWHNTKVASAPQTPGPLHPSSRNARRGQYKPRLRKTGLRTRHTTRRQSACDTHLCLFFVPFHIFLECVTDEIRWTRCHLKVGITM